MDPPPLRGRRLGHRADQHWCGRDVLAGAIEDWGLLAPFVVVVDAMMYIAGPSSSSSAFATTSLLLFERVSKLL